MEALWARFIVHTARNQYTMATLRTALINFRCHYEGCFSYEVEILTAPSHILCVQCGTLHENPLSLYVVSVPQCGQCIPNSNPLWKHLSTYINACCHKQPRLLEHIHRAYLHR